MRRKWEGVLTVQSSRKYVFLIPKVQSKIIYPLLAGTAATCEAFPSTFTVWVEVVEVYKLRMFGGPEHSVGIVVITLVYVPGMVSWLRSASGCADKPGANLSCVDTQSARRGVYGQSYDMPL